MKATTGGGNSDFPMLDEGGYLARVYSIVDIGIHNTNFGEKHQVVISWELPTELGDDGRPYAQSRFYTMSLNEKANLRKDLESMKGKIPNDKLEDPTFVDSIFTKLLGTPAQLSVSQYTNKDGYLRNGIEGIGKPMKGVSIPEAVNDTVLFDLEHYDQKIYNNLPDWLKAKIDEGKPRFDALNGLTSTSDDGIVIDGDEDDDVEW